MEGLRIVLALDPALPAILCLPHPSLLPGSAELTPFLPTIPSVLFCSPEVCRFIPNTVLLHRTLGQLFFLQAEDQLLFFFLSQ